MKKILTFLSVLVLATSCSSSDDSNSPSSSDWTKVSSTGDAYPISYCSNGTNLFVGTAGNGVYRSTNNGDSWSLVNNGITDTKQCMIFTNGSDLYLSTSILVIGSPSITKYYKSTDNGDNWTVIWSPLGNNTGMPREISFFGSTILIGSGSKIHKSIDSGANWTTSTITPGESVWKFASDGTNFYTTTETGELYKSSGSSFNLVNTNSITNEGTFRNITSIGTKLFIGDAYLQGGVYMSVDNGINWIPVNNGIENQWSNSLQVYGTDLFLEVQTVFINLVIMVQIGTN